MALLICFTSFFLLLRKHLLWIFFCHILYSMLQVFLGLCLCCFLCCPAASTTSVKNSFTVITLSSIQGKKHCFYSLILFPCPQLLHIFKVKPKVLDPSLFLNVHIESQRFVRFELLPVEVTVHQMTQSELKNIGFKKTCKHSHMLESRNMILDIVSDTHKFTAASLLFYHQVTANTFI